MRLEMLFITLLFFVFLGVDFLVHENRSVNDYSQYVVISNDSSLEYIDKENYDEKKAQVILEKMNESKGERVSYVEIPSEKELIINDELEERNQEFNKLQNSSLIVIVE